MINIMDPNIIEIAKEFTGMDIVKTLYFLLSLG